MPTRDAATAHQLPAVAGATQSVVERGHRHVYVPSVYRLAAVLSPQPPLPTVMTTGPKKTVRSNSTGHYSANGSSSSASNYSGDDDQAPAARASYIFGSGDRDGNKEEGMHDAILRNQGGRTGGDDDGDVAVRAVFDAVYSRDGRRKVAGVRDVVEEVEGLGYGARLCARDEGGASAMETSQVCGCRIGWVPAQGLIGGGEGGGRCYIK